MSAISQALLMAGAATDPYFSSVVLLLNGNGTDGSKDFVDNSNYNHRIYPLPDSYLDTAWSDFGASSFAFDSQTGKNRCRGLAMYQQSTEFDMGSGDWTMESAIRLTSYAELHNAVYFSVIAQQYDVSATPRGFYWYISGTASSYDTFGFWCVINGTNRLYTTSQSFSLNTTYHLRVVRSGNNIYFYVDGTRIATHAITSPGAMGNNSAEPLYIGNSPQTRSATAAVWHAFYGFIDSFRWTKGVARSTGASYAVPAAEFYGLPGSLYTSDNYYHLGDRGLTTGGYDGTTDVIAIDYWTISTGGAAGDFGDLSVVRRATRDVCNGTRGVIFGGAIASTTYLNTIDYVTVASPNNASDFGDLVVTVSSGAAFSDATTGVNCGGASAAGTRTTCNYVTIATAANALTYGNQSGARDLHAGTGDDTRGMIGCGRNGTPSILSTTEYWTTSTPGNATNFGNLVQSRCSVSAASNMTRACWAGGSTSSASNGSQQNQIDYHTIQTLATGKDFGNLLQSRYNGAGFGNGTWNVWNGGCYTTSNTNLSSCEYTGSFVPSRAVDWATMTQPLRAFGGLSGN